MTNLKWSPRGDHVVLSIFEFYIHIIILINIDVSFNNNISFDLKNSNFPLFPLHFQLKLDDHNYGCICL